MRARWLPCLIAGLLAGPLAAAFPAAPARAQVDTSRDTGTGEEAAPAPAGEAAPAPAAGGGVRAVDLYAPRAFGYVLGDAFSHQVEIALDPAFTLDAAALPRPRAVTYWLELREVRLEDLGRHDGARRYRLHLGYQTFYAPLEPKRLEVPAVMLAATDGTRRVEARVPAWSFLMSPLREVSGAAPGEALRLRPDAGARPVPTGGALAQLAAAGGAGLLALAALAFQMGWWPFRPGASRPFAAAARRVRRRLDASAGEMDSSSTSPHSSSYAAALLELHRAFDASAGRRLLADDLDGFLAARPGLAAAAPEIRRLFAASRLAFFGENIDIAKTCLPAAELGGLARRLARLERRG
ncbi:nonribosomal peptide synthetase MxaA [Ancylobacter lacus]|uniref:nonribosomal peptide synthetase MxaA n=1 Tax=Ancylobacter lacus TaxID=2579970 RepID=UPI001BD0B9F9|nr:nonribosomal peptide synthetase MxaA [Ancylobacter lacus]MBS7538863.1 nonribosomal peptide synthetase MxaA [Ancylobacter lacus]